jgi:hypothetical protein
VGAGGTAKAGAIDPKRSEKTAVTAPACLALFNSRALLPGPAIGWLISIYSHCCG